MEVWIDNVRNYDSGIESGDIVELSINFDDNVQGLYVPTYDQRSEKELNLPPNLNQLQICLNIGRFFKIR